MKYDDFWFVSMLDWMCEWGFVEVECRYEMYGECVQINYVLSLRFILVL